jgi:cbb3-type cytochrome oxidase subunit 3
MQAGVMDHVGVWLAAFLTLGILSFLYRDNVWYKICEAVFVGISAGYYLVTYFWDNLYGKLWIGIFPRTGDTRADGWYMLLFGGVLGLMMLMRLLPKIGWISRWPLAFIVGATAGLYLVTKFASNVMAQVQDTIRPLGAADLYDTIGTIVVFVATVTCLIYFFFSKEHKGAFGKAARLGIIFLMITFGASFGYTVMSRMSLLIYRVDYLLGDWLGLIR